MAITGLQVIVALLVSILGYYTAYFVYDSYRMRHFPGPFSVPLIGSLWDPGFLQFYRHFKTLRRKYGKIVRFFSFSKPMMLICDPIVARRILSEPKSFVKGDDYTVFFSRVFGKGLVTSNGEDHRHGRTVLGKYFIRQSIAKFSESFNRITKLMIDTYLMSELNHDLNMEEFFARLALRCFMQFSCQVDTSADPAWEKSFCRVVSKASYAMALTLMTREPFYEVFPNSRILFGFNRTCKDYFQKVVEDRKVKLAKGETFDDMLQALLDDNEIDDKARLDHFKTIISAGHDTTAFFMSYLVYLLARNPEVQNKLRAYLQEKLGDKEVITADDIAQLKYLQCCMMEALRMYPTIPGFSRECHEDIHIVEDGIDVVIPKNVSLIIPLIVLNKDEEIWKDPETYNPDRFEGKSSADFTSAKDGFFPFAYGTRICIGNTLAQIEASIVFVHLLRRFEFTPVENFRPNIRAGISLTTSNGIKVHLSPLSTSK